MVNYEKSSGYKLEHDVEFVLESTLKNIFVQTMTLFYTKKTVPFGYMVWRYRALYVLVGVGTPSSGQVMQQCTERQ